MLNGSQDLYGLEIVIYTFSTTVAKEAGFQGISNDDVAESLESHYVLLMTN
jgi:hypothetical protein